MNTKPLSKIGQENHAGGPGAGPGASGAPGRGPGAGRL